MTLTQNSDDLGLDGKLTLETTRNVRDMAATILSDVRCIADLVEHLAGCEDEHRKQGKETPEPAA